MKNKFLIFLLPLFFVVNVSAETFTEIVGTTQDFVYSEAKYLDCSVTGTNCFMKSLKTSNGSTIRVNQNSLGNRYFFSQFEYTLGVPTSEWIAGQEYVFTWSIESNQSGVFKVGSYSCNVYGRDLQVLDNAKCEVSTNDLSMQVTARFNAVGNGNQVYVRLTNDALNNSTVYSDIDSFPYYEFLMDDSKSNRPTVTVNKSVRFVRVNDPSISINNNINGVNDNITNSNVDNNEVLSFLDDFNSKLPGSNVVSSLLTMPIKFLQSFSTGVNSACSNFNLGSIFGQEIVLPCIDLSEKFGTVWNVIDVLMCGFMIFNISKKMVRVFTDITNLEDKQSISDMFGGSN